MVRAEHKNNIQLQLDFVINYPYHYTLIATLGPIFKFQFSENLGASALEFPSSLFFSRKTS